MAAYRLTDEAQRDLKQIKKYTGIRFGTRHAREYLLKIRHTLERLAREPGCPLRRFPCASHIITPRLIPALSCSPCCTIAACLPVNSPPGGFEPLSFAPAPPAR
ncbi:type II toxin-antitoxin system RelE/ParE family toxin [Cronobacter universalis]